MHYWLKRFLPHIDYRILTQHTLPVIVIHTRELLHLDRAFQAVAFPDMVIAIVNSPNSGIMVKEAKREGVFGLTFAADSV